MNVSVETFGVKKHNKGWTYFVGKTLDRIVGKDEPAQELRKRCARKLDHAVATKRHHAERGQRAHVRRAREVVVGRKQNVQTSQVREIRREILDAPVADVKHRGAAHAGNRERRQLHEPLDANAMRVGRLPVEQLLQRELAGHVRGTGAG